MMTKEQFNRVLSILSAILIGVSGFFLKTTPEKPPETSGRDVYIREKTPWELETEAYIADWTCDDEDAFYERYFADYETMAAMHNLDNVLIVTTKETLEDDFGAIFTVTAPYYTFFFQYPDEAQRENAYAQFEKLKEDGVVFSVNRNQRIYKAMP